MNNKSTFSPLLMMWGPGGSGLLSKLFIDDSPAKALMILGAFFFVALYIIPKLPATESEEQAAVPFH